MIRKKEFDILKGILIILVVVGHTELKIPYINPFWFHMPAFFIVTGYLTKQWTSIKKLTLMNRHELLQKTAKYILPYFSYSFFLYIIFRPESILKNTLRVLYAGANNTTIYSFPFWYINALFIATLIYGSINSSNTKKIITLVIFWTLIHTDLFRNIIPIPLPWSIDNALAATIFLFIGDLAKNIQYKKWHLLFLLIPILFIICNEYFHLNYQINMKSMTFDHLFLDLIVPVTFTYLLYILSININRIKGINTTLSYIGKYCMTIYFTHAAILYLGQQYLQWKTIPSILLCIASGMLLHRLFISFKLTRILFIGKS